MSSLGHVLETPHRRSSALRVIPGSWSTLSQNRPRRVRLCRQTHHAGRQSAKRRSRRVRRAWLLAWKKRLDAVVLQTYPRLRDRFRSSLRRVRPSPILLLPCNEFPLGHPSCTRNIPSIQLAFSKNARHDLPDCLRLVRSTGSGPDWFPRCSARCRVSPGCPGILRNSKILERPNILLAERERCLH